MEELDEVVRNSTGGWWPDGFNASIIDTADLPIQIARGHIIDKFDLGTPKPTIRFNRLEEQTNKPG